MKATAITIEHLINAEQVFTIPNFQRRYRWQRAQWSLLFDDVVREMESAAHDKDGHFLGSIVIHRALDSDKYMLPHWMVIDGQQRLTSVLLFLAAIRDHFTAAHAPVHAEEINAKYLRNPYADESEQQRIEPTQLDVKQYEATVHGGAPAGRFGEGFDYFRSRITNSRLNNVESLEALLKTLTQRMLVVRIEVERRDAINSIFNTLNSKGLPLNAGDLIKNELLLAFDEDKAGSLYSKIWAPIEEALVIDEKGKVDDRKLVTFFWARELPFNRSVTKKNLFTVFEARHRELIRVHGSPKASTKVALQELKNIEKSFDTFRKIDDLRVGVRRLPKPIYTEIKFFKAWASEIHLPISMWIIEALTEFPDRITESDAALTLRMLKSFLVRRALAGLPTNNLNSMLSGIPAELQRTFSSRAEDASLPSVFGNLLNSPSFHWPTDLEVVGNAVSVPIMKSIKGPQVRTLLELAYHSEYRTGKISMLVPRNPAISVLSEIGVPAENFDYGYTTLPYTLGNLFPPGLLKELPSPVDAASRTADAILRAEDKGTLAERIGLRSQELARHILAAIEVPPLTSQATREGASPEDTIRNLLALFPEKSWTNLPVFASVCHVTPEDALEALALVPAYHARFVRDEKGNPLQGLPTHLIRAILSEDLAAQSRFTEKNFLSDEELYDILSESAELDY